MHNDEAPPDPAWFMYQDRSEVCPPGWRASTARDGVRFVCESVVLEAMPTRTGADRWRLICSARTDDAEFVDEFGTVRSRETAIDLLRSAAWLVHEHGIDAEHVGVALERDGQGVTWRGWQFE